MHLNPLENASYHLSNHIVCLLVLHWIKSSILTLSLLHLDDHNALLRLDHIEDWRDEISICDALAFHDVCDV